MGMYDGYSGLFKKPYKGAKEDGALGFVKGIGKGVGGFMTQNGSGKFYLIFSGPVLLTWNSDIWICCVSSIGTLPKLKPVFSYWCKGRDSNSARVTWSMAS